MACSEDSGPIPEDVGIEAERSERLLPWLAALSSAGISYRLEKTAAGWCIRVAAEDEARTRTELAEYDRVNCDWPPLARDVADQEAQSDVPAEVSLVVAASLVVFYACTGPFDATAPFFREGCADSRRILAGEWWRLLTALTLHADIPHVLANAACCVFFGIGVCRRAGVGLGWSLVLVSGVAGNAAAVHLSEAARTSLGASTATFGALGLLSAFQLLRNYRRYGTLRGVWNRTWVPLGAAMGFLALLGTSARADLAGHLFGFVAGFVLALAATPLLSRQISPYAQLLLGVAVWASVYGAWQVALF